MKKIKILILFLSFLCFVTSTFSGNCLLDYFGLVYYIFLLITIHEFGHVFGCLITKSKIISITIFGIEISDKFNISKNLSCNVKFVGNKHKKLIYLFGIIFTILSYILILMCYLYYKISIVYLITSTLILIFNFLPLKNSDIMNLFARK